MNYIKSLQEENKQLKEIIARAQVEINQFNMFLVSPKFIGLENGERKDWISTGDTMRATREIQFILNESQIY